MTGGYDLDQFYPAPDHDLVCCICYCIMCDPLESPCRHVFCRTCITTWLNNGNLTCPTCRKPTTNEQLTPVLPIIQNMINRLTVRCKYHEQGCEKLISLETRDSHVKSCDFEPATCRYERCKMVLTKRTLREHEERCPFKEVQCSGDCQLYILLSELPTHNCVTALRHQIQQNDNRITSLLQTIDTLRQEKSDLQQQLTRYQDDIDRWTPSIMSGSSTASIPSISIHDSEDDSLYEIHIDTDDDDDLSSHLSAALTSDIRENLAMRLHDVSTDSTQDDLFDDSTEVTDPDVTHHFDVTDTDVASMDLTNIHPRDVNVTSTDTVAMDLTNINTMDLPNTIETSFQAPVLANTTNTDSSILLLDETYPNVSEASTSYEPSVNYETNYETATENETDSPSALINELYHISCDYNQMLGNVSGPLSSRTTSIITSMYQDSPVYRYPPLTTSTRTTVYQQPEITFEAQNNRIIVQPRRPSQMATATITSPAEEIGVIPTADSSTDDSFGRMLEATSLPRSAHVPVTSSVPAAVNGQVIIVPRDQARTNGIYTIANAGTQQQHQEQRLPEGTHRMAAPRNLYISDSESSYDSDYHPPGVADSPVSTSTSSDMLGPHSPLSNESTPLQFGPGNSPQSPANMSDDPDSSNSEFSSHTFKSWGASSRHSSPLRLSSMSSISSIASISPPYSPIRSPSPIGSPSPPPTIPLLTSHTIDWPARNHSFDSSSSDSDSPSNSCVNSSRLPAPARIEPDSNAVRIARLKAFMRTEPNPWHRLSMTPPERSGLVRQTNSDSVILVSDDTESNIVVIPDNETSNEATAIVPHSSNPWENNATSTASSNQSMLDKYRNHSRNPGKDVAIVKPLTILPSKRKSQPSATQSSASQPTQPKRSRPLLDTAFPPLSTNSRASYSGEPPLLNVRVDLSLNVQNESGQTAINGITRRHTMDPSGAHRYDDTALMQSNAFTRRRESLRHPTQSFSNAAAVGQSDSRTFERRALRVNSTSVQGLPGAAHTATSDQYNIQGQTMQTSARDSFANWRDMNGNNTLSESTMSSSSANFACVSSETRTDEANNSLVTSPRRRPRMKLPLHCDTLLSVYADSDEDSEMDSSWQPENHGDTVPESDTTMSEEEESEPGSDYQVLIPKSTAQLLDEYASNDTDDSWKDTHEH